MAYHYKECGLDNVYLTNGYVEHDTPYGKGIAIHEAEGLHKFIGKMVVEQPCPLIGAELRFLRLEMEISQRNLGEMLGHDEQSVRRWEKARNRTFNGSADRLLRALYLEYINGDGSVRRMVNRMAELDCQERAPIRLKEVNDHWEQERACA